MRDMIIVEYKNNSNSYDDTKVYTRIFDNHYEVNNFLKNHDVTLIRCEEKR